MEIPITKPNENGVFTAATRVELVKDSEWSITVNIAYDGEKYYYGYNWSGRLSGGCAPCSMKGSCFKDDFAAAVRAAIMLLVEHKNLPQSVKTALLEKRFEYAQQTLF